MKEKVKVKVFFTAVEPGHPTWPYINYDYPKRAREVMRLLMESLPEVEFFETIISSVEEAKKEARTNEDVDGYLVYLIALKWSELSEEVIKSGRPTLLVDDLYAGSGKFLKVYGFTRKEGFPVVGITSSRFQDVVGGVRLFSVMKQMK